MTVEHNSVDELIKKSLEDIEEMAEQFAKSQTDEDIKPSEVSESADEGTEDAEGEEGTDEGAETSQPEEGMEDPTEGNEPDVDEDSEGEEDEEEEEVEKSLSSAMKENKDVKKALEVSEFLNELVKSLDVVINSHKSDLNKSIAGTERSNELLAKSLLGITKAHQTIMKSQSELYKSVQEIYKRLDSMSSQPVVRKSVASNAQPIPKAFDNAQQGTSITKSATAQQATLSKSQVTSALMTKFNEGNREIMSDILAFEHTGDINALSSEAKGILGI